MSIWCECAQPEVGRKIKSLNTFFCLFQIVFILVMTACAAVKRRNKKFWLNKLRLSALTSHTHHQAAKSSPNWRPPDLKDWATLIDKNFKGVESSLEVKILVSNLPLYILYFCIFVFCEKMKIFVLCVIFGKSSQKIAWISSNYFKSLLLPQ